MSPLKCRKEAPIDAAGPSQAKKQKVQKKKGTPKKKKTPIKKKLKKATADPPTTVVRMLEPCMVVNLVCCYVDLSGCEPVKSWIPVVL